MLESILAPPLSATSLHNDDVVESITNCFSKEIDFPQFQASSVVKIAILLPGLGSPYFVLKYFR